MAVVADTAAAPAPAIPVSSRGLRTYSARTRALIFVVTGIGLLALWELVARAFLPDYVARPTGIVPAIPRVLFGSSTASSAIDLGQTQSFWSDVLASCGAIVVGMVIGTVAGAILGLAMGRIERVRWFLTVYVRGLYAMPLIALVPLVTLWLGYGSAARLAVVVVATILPVTVTTADGSRATSQDYLDVGRIFGARGPQVWLGIALPAAIPHIMAGVQISMARAVTNVVAVEVLATVPGLGLSTYSNSSSFHENEAFVYVLALAAFAIGARRLIFLGRRRLAPWYD